MCFFGQRRLDQTRLAQKPLSGISLCNLSVLCVSVVLFYSEFINHRGTENTEVAQRSVIRPLLAITGLSRSSLDQVSLNHKMALVPDGREQYGDPVASFDFTFKDSHQIL